MESGSAARDTLSDEASGMRAWHAGTGAPLWHQPRYAGPAMLRGEAPQLMTKSFFCAGE